MVILPPEPEDASDVHSDDDLPVVSYTISLSEPKHEDEDNEPDAWAKGLLLSYIVVLLVLDGPWHDEQLETGISISYYLASLQEETEDANDFTSLSLSLDFVDDIGASDMHEIPSSNASMLDGDV